MWKSISLAVAVLISAVYAERPIIAPSNKFL